MTSLYKNLDITIDESTVQKLNANFTAINDFFQKLKNEKGETHIITQYEFLQSLQSYLKINYDENIVNLIIKMNDINEYIWSGTPKE